MTYDGTDQSAVIIRGAGKIIGCLIAQSCRRGGGGERGRWLRAIDDRPRKIGRGGEQSIVRFHRLLIYALAALYTRPKRNKELVIRLCFY